MFMNVRKTFYTFRRFLRFHTVCDLSRPFGVDGHALRRRIEFRRQRVSEGKCERAEKRAERKFLAILPIDVAR